MRFACLPIVLLVAVALPVAAQVEVCPEGGAPLPGGCAPEQATPEGAGGASPGPTGAAPADGAAAAGWALVAVVGLLLVVGVAVMLRRPAARGLWRR